MSIRRRDLLVVSGVMLVVILFLAIQIGLGTEYPLVLLLSLGTISAFLPSILLGFNLYSLLPIVFYVRYEGFALVIKTAALQTLQSNLSYPTAAYELTATLMLIIATVCYASSFFDRGASLLKEPIDVTQMRRLGRLCAVAGFAGSILTSLLQGRTAGLATANPFFILVATLQGLFPLAIVAEVAFNIKTSGARRAFSLSVYVLLALALVLAVIQSARILLVSSILGVVITLIATNALKVRYIIAGLFVAIMFFAVISPAVLAARAYRYSGTSREAIVAGGGEAFRALTDPEYLQTVKTEQQINQRYRNLKNDFDYYGNQSNILNRLSWIALVDQIYTASKGKSLIGDAAVTECAGLLLPRFLNPGKSERTEGYSDWLSKQMGIENEAESKSYSFPLSLEGLVVAGLPGYIFLSSAGFFLVVVAFSKVASWKRPGPYAIFLFTSVQTPIFEGNSATILGLMTRQFPITVVVLLVLGLIVQGRNKSGRPPRPTRLRSPAVRLMRDA